MSCRSSRKADPSPPPRNRLGPMGGTGSGLAGGSQTRPGQRRRASQGDGIGRGRFIARSSPPARRKAEAEMKAYTNTIPGTAVTYAMVPIPGGEFVMGSPDDRGAPQRRRRARSTRSKSSRSGWSNARSRGTNTNCSCIRTRAQPAAARRRHDQLHEPIRRRGDASHQALRGDEFRHGQGRLPGHQHDAARLQQLLPVAQRQDRPFLPPAHRGGMGIRLPRRHDDRLFLWRRSGQAGRIRLVRATTAISSIRKSARKSPIPGDFTT